jgi:hypothetical protein
MPSEPASDGSCFEVRYLQWTEEQERQWVRDLSTLCLQLYEEER